MSGNEVKGNMRLCGDLHSTDLQNDTGCQGKRNNMKTLETPRLILREFVQEDFDALFAILSDPETMKHYPKPYDVAGVQRWLDWSFASYRDFGFGLWAAILKETGGLIGDCGVTMQPIGGWIRPEIGYHVHKVYWRQGLGSEAARAVRDWAFQHTPFETLYSYMAKSNVASQATALANGMRLIQEYVDEKNGKTSIYAITRKEWEEGSFTD